MAFRIMKSCCQGGTGFDLTFDVGGVPYYLGNPKVQNSAHPSDNSETNNVFGETLPSALSGGDDEVAVGPYVFFAGDLTGGGEYLGRLNVETGAFDHLPVSGDADAQELVDALRLVETPSNWNRTAWPGRGFGSAPAGSDGQANRTLTSSASGVLRYVTESGTSAFWKTIEWAGGQLVVNDQSILPKMVTGKVYVSPPPGFTGSNETASLFARLDGTPMAVPLFSPPQSGGWAFGLEFADSNGQPTGYTIDGFLQHFFGISEGRNDVAVVAGPLDQHGLVTPTVKLASASRVHAALPDLGQPRLFDTPYSNPFDPEDYRRDLTFGIFRGAGVPITSVQFADAWAPRNNAAALLLSNQVEDPGEVQSALRGLWVNTTKARDFWEAIGFVGVNNPIDTDKDALLSSAQAAGLTINDWPFPESVWSSASNGPRSSWDATTGQKWYERSVEGVICPVDGATAIVAYAELSIDKSGANLVDVMRIRLEFRGVAAVDQVTDPVPRQSGEAFRFLAKGRHFVYANGPASGGGDKGIAIRNDGGGYFAAEADLWRHWAVNWTGSPEISEATDTFDEA